MSTLTAILSSLLGGIVSAINYITNFITNLANVPDVLTHILAVVNGQAGQFFEWIIAKILEIILVAVFYVAAAVIPFVWNIASQILTDIITATNLQSYANALPQSIQVLLNVTGVWTALDMIITAYITRFIFRLLPLLGMAL